MKLRITFAVLVLASLPLTADAAKKKQPLILEVATSETAQPKVTLTASDEPLSEVAERLAKKLGTTIEVSAAAKKFRVTTDLDQQPLDLTLRELAPQAYVDGILTGGTGKNQILAVHLLSAGEPAPSMNELTKSSSQVLMFFGNTEDENLDPFAGKLEVDYRNGRLRVFASKQALSVVVARLADTLGIPFELVGDSREVVDVSVADATPAQVMAALTPSVKLYHRQNLTTFEMTPVRLVLQETFSPKTDAKPVSE
jgi:hypothetical protein